jgi:WD40 repeat protein
LRAVGKVGKLKEDSGFESVQSLAFSNSGRLVFSSYNNNKIKIWDVLNETKVNQMENNKEAIKTISMSLDGSTLVSGSKDGVITLWS